MGTPRLRSMSWKGCLTRFMKDERPIGEEVVVHSSRVFEVTNQLYQVGDKEVLFEFAKRAPGVRLLIIDEQKILLSREFRPELGGFDYRLPGGKMFSKYSEYKNARDDEEVLMEAAERAVREECEEEAGLIPQKIEHLYTTSPGATVVWDLFYFLVTEFDKHPDGQHLKEAEVIETEWKTFEEVKNMCLDGSIQEDRTVAVLLRFLIGRGV